MKRSLESLKLPYHFWRPYNKQLCWNLTSLTILTMCKSLEQICLLLGCHRNPYIHMVSIAHTSCGYMSLSYNASFRLALRNSIIQFSFIWCYFFHGGNIQESRNPQAVILVTVQILWRQFLMQFLLYLPNPLWRTNLHGILYGLNRTNYMVMETSSSRYAVIMKGSLLHHLARYWCHSCSDSSDICG